MIDAEAPDSFRQRILPEELMKQRKAAEYTAETNLEHARTVIAEYSILHLRVFKY